MSAVISLARVFRLQWRRLKPAAVSVGPSSLVLKVRQKRQKQLHARGTLQSICEKETDQTLESSFMKSSDRQHWLCQVCDRQLMQIIRGIRDQESDKKTVGGTRPVR